MCGCGLPTGIAARTDRAKGFYKDRHYKFRRGHGLRGVEGEQTSRWQGGRILTAEGYVKIRVGGTRRYYPEHRLVMEQHLGRDLRTEENVHHVNGVKTDNRIENLELWTKSQPCGQRVEDKVRWAVELLTTYAPHSLSKEPFQLRL